jgi:hypothetical protein
MRYAKQPDKRCNTVISCMISYPTKISSIFKMPKILFVKLKELISKNGKSINGNCKNKEI